MKAPKIGKVTFVGGSSTGGFLTSDNTLALEGKGTPGAKITIFDNGKKIGTAKADKKGKWSFDSKALLDGAHSLTAKAKLGKDVSPASKALIGEIDVTAPLAPQAPDLAAASDGGSSNSDDITNVNTPTLTGTAEAGSTVTIKDGATVLGTVTAHAATGAWTFTTGVLANGAHSLTATATDTAGNTGPASAALVVTVDKVAPGAPTVDLVAASDSGSSNSDDITNDTTPTLAGTAEAGAIVTIKDGATVLGTVTAHATTGAWTFTTGALSEGAHSLTATATDAAGNTGPASAALVVTVDTSTLAPLVPDLDVASDTGSSSTDDLTKDATPTLSGTTEPGATVTIKDGATVLGTAVANGAGQWTFTTGVLSNTAHSLTATATDKAGNTGPASAELVVTVDTVAPPAPTITGFADDTGGAGDHVTLDTTLVISGTAEAGATVQIFDRLVSLGSATANGSGEWSFATAVLGGGDHSFTAQRSDAAGNIGISAALDVSIGLDIDVATMTTNRGFRIFGAEIFDEVGTSVSSAGDINGDGFDDLIVGSRYADGAGNGKSNSGEAIVVFGKATGFVNIDLTAPLSSTDGFRIFGADTGDRAGSSVSSAGDINGDGFDDMIIGAPRADGAANGKSDAGEAIVVFGKATGLADIDVSASDFVSSGAGFRIFGADAGDYSGWSVSSAGDINGDGFDDLLVGAQYGDGAAGSKSYAGEAIVVFGKATGFADVDVSTMSPTVGFRIFGADAGDRAGISVSSAGDINGDGFDDLIVGARFGAGPINTELRAGEAIVVFGRATGFADIDVSASDFVSSGTGFRIFGADSNDYAGFSVAAAGDINGDGFDDLILGATGAFNNPSAPSETIVVFGKSTGFDDVDVSSPTFTSSGTGFRIIGADGGDRAGRSVSCAGDVNGDGYDDLIIGASNSDGTANGRSNSGEAIVVFGKASAFVDIDLAAPLSPADGFRIYGADVDDYAGFSVSSAGDIDGDGFDDLVVGAYSGEGATNNANRKGEAIVIFGGDLTGSVVHAGTSGANTLTGDGTAETFVAGQGDDTVTGGGGADSFDGGSGDDTITVPDLAFRKIDGGSGTDKLVFSGTDQTIDFTTFANNKVVGIEEMDVTGSGADTIVIGALDALHFSDTPHADFTAAGSHNRLVVTGDAGDTLDLRDFAPGSGGDYTWQLDATDKSLSGAAGGFDFYNLVRGANVLASIAVDADMTVLLAP